MENSHPQAETLRPDPAQKVYDARQFLLVTEDRSFVESAYQCILKRHPDPEGFSSYLDILAKGGLRQHVLADLLLSKEARSQGVSLTHLRSFTTWAAIRRQFPRAARLLVPAAWAMQRILGRLQHIQALQLRARLAQDQAFRTAIRAARQEMQAQARRIEILEDQNAALRARLQLLKSRDPNHQERHEPARVAAEGIAAPESWQKQWQEDFSDFYLAFEDVFRGSRAAMRERLEYYLGILPPPAAESARVVDLGCGRGEWLALLQAAGYTARGLDSNPVMLEICREQGLDVSDTPLHLFLKDLPDASLAAVTAFHLAEHLPFEYLLVLVKEARRLLQPGGMLMIETQNPESLRVSAYAFYHDPTHRNPLTPELLEFTAHYVGFQQVRLHRLSEVPEDQQIRETTETAVQFNQLLNAPRDLALVARQPGDTPADDRREPVFS